MTDFIFCIHNHQPVGNFEIVMEDAYVKSYLPFLRAVAEHSSLKISYHTTGFLLDWFVENHPEYIDILKGLQSAGRLEILGGGYYEPILPILPEEDRVGQIVMMSDRIEELFGVRPRGMWLAERVWEPALPQTLKRAGMDYVVLDDFHLQRAGLSDREIRRGYYITEDAGHSINIFGGSESMRYLVPFRPAEDIGSFFNEVGEESENSLVVYADDGEKFGVWPKTHEWVFERGWLESFLKLMGRLEGEVDFTTFTEFLDNNPASGRIYPQPTSYMEMGEWTLPPEAAKAFERAKESADEDLKPFLQGGIWRGFLSKYPESNWMHKRMIKASRALCAAAPDMKSAPYEAARRFLYMSQSNDALWHGVFGGIYLPHLRGAVFENILAAEKLLEDNSGPGAITESGDFDADGFEEIIVRSDDLNLFISPEAGGTLFELDYKPALVNLSNTLTRWYESYHDRVAEEEVRALNKDEAEGSGDDGDFIATIHGSMGLKESGLAELLKYDSEKRASFRERLLRADTDIELFKSGDFTELAGFSGPYESHIDNCSASVSLTRKAVVDGISLNIKKEYQITGPSEFTVSFTVDGGASSGGATESALLTMELNLYLPASDGVATSYDFGHHLEGAEEAEEARGLASTGVINCIEGIKLIDGYTGLEIKVGLSKGATMWRYPIETVSQSESGFERIFQGSSLLFLYPVEVGRAGSLFSGSFTVSVNKIDPWRF